MRVRVSVVVARGRCVRLKSFAKVRSWAHVAITCGTLRWTCFSPHLIIVLSIYELGPGSTPVSRYDDTTSWQTESTLCTHELGTGCCLADLQDPADFSST